MRKKYSPAEQRRFLDDIRDSGESLEVVARRFGISKSTAYKWHKLAKGSHASSKASPKPKFARLVPASRPAIVVEIGGARVHVEAGFDPELLRSLVAALGGLPR